jgi:ubiquinone/menaquinone biosynthesis C-methylase UbiE
VADPARPPYDEVADSYRRVLDTDGLGLADPVLTELLGDIAGQLVLSLACGQGQDARLLAQLGGSVVGIDISSEMLRYAHEHEAADPRGITYLQGDAQDLAALADRSFDGVLCHMALMDIPGLAAAIQSVARVLRREGWFAFSIVHPAYEPHVEIITDYLLDHRYEKRAPVDWLPRHAYHRPLSAYVTALVDAGFRIEQVTEAHQRASNDVVAKRRERDAGRVPGLLYLRARRV